MSSRPLFQDETTSTSNLLENASPLSVSLNDNKDDFREREHARGILNSSLVCPEHNASVYSLITFSWINQLLKLGYKRPLELDDTYQLPLKYQTSTLVNRLKTSWMSKISESLFGPNQGVPPNHKNILLKSIASTFGKRWGFAGLLKLTSDSATVLTPVILAILIDSISKKSESDPYYYYISSIYCVIIFLLLSLGSFCVNCYFQTVMVEGFCIRTAINGNIYEKALRLNGLSRQRFSSGRIVNLVSTDTSKIETAMGFLHYTWSALFQIIFILGLLIYALKLAALAGVLVLFIAIPYQSIVMKRLSAYRKQVSSITDQRVKLTQEILQGIRTIKFYAWEMAFLNRLKGLREKEVALIKKIQVMKAFTNAIAMSLPIFSSILAFAIYHLMGNELNPSIVFSSLAYFNLLRIPLMLLPNVITMVVDAYVALNRVQDFLLAEELSFHPVVDKSSPYAIQVTNAEFIWETMPNTRTSVPTSKHKSFYQRFKIKLNKYNLTLPENKPETLASGFSIKNIHLCIPHGKLVAVIGSVGSGKSSLLNSFVGEMKHVQGDVKFNGSIGYCPQQAWMQNTSLKNNILFGLPFDFEKYSKILQVCALFPDLQALPDGDETEIGEKGINLSGGQKQRINLARAVYSDPDIVLLDDPLSAVDANVGKYIFDECICGILKNKTRILVAHQLSLLPKTDWIVYMCNGEIKEQGSFYELMQKDGFVKNLYECYAEKTEKSSDEEPSQLSGSSSSHLDLPPAFFNSTTSRKALMTSEERAFGTVSSKVYRYYITESGGTYFLILAVGTLVLSQIARIGTDWWLSLWTESHKYFSMSDSHYLTVYVLLGCFQVIFILCSGLIFSFGGIKAARTLHIKELMSVLHSPLKFFDTTPLGRIINRFSKDQDSVDSVLPDSIRSFGLTLSNAASTFIFISFVTPIFLAPLAVLLLVYYLVQGFYRATSRELKRLDALTRSPLYAHYSETLSGLSTIRATKVEPQFIEKCFSAIDINNRPMFLQLTIQRWLGLRLEMIGNVLVLFAGLLCVLTDCSASLTGLALSYALSVIGILSWTIRQAAETEIHMNSVERITHYIYNLVSEPSWDTNDQIQLPFNWPSRGEIVFKDVSITYRPELQPALNLFSAKINPGEKIGIVGRTAAGKSTIVLALFRLIDPSNGVILIDDVDILKIGLKDLRKNLAIIPQDPILFSGTVRSNLDPFDEYSDSEIWQVLERSYLSDYVKAFPEKLELSVSENGENFSVGQKQLFCLARALLKKPHILVLDEATANVDLKTDALIQNIIRKDLPGVTILTIAHRLSTVIDYDRIMVMDSGHLMEFDRPDFLLNDKNSILYSLSKGSNK